MTLVFQAVNWVRQREARTVQREATVWLADDFIPPAGRGWCGRARGGGRPLCPQSGEKEEQGSPQAATADSLSP